jgi:hypothetical protein
MEAQSGTCRERSVLVGPREPRFQKPTSALLRSTVGGTWASRVADSKTSRARHSDLATTETRALPFIQRTADSVQPGPEARTERVPSLTATWVGSAQAGSKGASGRTRSRNLLSAYGYVPEMYCSMNNRSTASLTEWPSLNANVRCGVGWTSFILRDFYAHAGAIEAARKGACRLLVVCLWS